MQDASDNQRSSAVDSAKWLIEALAPDVDPLTMIAALRAGAGYHCVEWPLDPESRARNERVALVDRLAAQWAARNEQG